MKIVNSDSCAIRYIHYLGQDLDKTSDQLMEEFCKKELKRKIDPGPWGGHVGLGWDGITYNEDHPLYAIYVFNGTIENDRAYDYNYDDNYYGYAERFARFIKDHKFGKVYKSAPITNEAHHEDHDQIVYVWNPNPKTIIKWYEARLEAKKPKKVKK